MPTSLKVKKAMIRLIQESFPQGLQGHILELGSGFFPVIFDIELIFPNNSFIAYENSTIPFLLSKMIHSLFYKKNILISNKNFYHASFNEAGLLICYLYPAAMMELKKKFQNELKSGTIIVSNSFRIPDLKPIRVVTVNDIYNTKIYLYQM